MNQDERMDCPPEKLEEWLHSHPHPRGFRKFREAGPVFPEVRGVAPPSWWTAGGTARGEPRQGIGCERAWRLGLDLGDCGHGRTSQRRRATEPERAQYDWSIPIDGPPQAMERLLVDIRLFAGGAPDRALRTEFVVGPCSAHIERPELPQLGPRPPSRADADPQFGRSFDIFDADFFHPDFPRIRRAFRRRATE